MSSETKRTFKNEVYGQFARVGQALASGRRLELIDLLAQRARTVEELAEEAGMSMANTSQHLQVLRAARLVDVRRDGLYASYRLAGPDVFRLWQALRETGEARLAEIERVVKNYLHDRRKLEPVTAEELAQRLRRGGVVVLDVRPAEEFEAGHIRGARSIPLAELDARLREVPKGREIVAYCRGPYCVFADEAVALLRARGYRARRLDAGFPDWQARGFPAEGENLWQSRVL